MLSYRHTLTAIIVATITTTTPAADWPAYRGHNGQGTTTDTTILSSSRDIGLEIKWVHELGSGYTGAVVGKGKVVTIYSDGTDDIVAAFDQNSGKPLWKFPIDKTYEGHDGSHTGGISTPLIAAGHVYALAPRGRFVALNLNDGKLAWSTDLVEDHDAVKPHYGFGTSPMYANDLVLLQYGTSASGENDIQPAAIAAFDPKTGQKKWTKGADSVQYQSPIIHASLGHDPHLIATGDKKIIAVDPATGDIAWQHDHGGGGARGVASLTPVPAGDRRYFLAYQDNASAMFTLDGESADTKFNEKWSGRQIRNSFNVPVYHDGHLYAYSSRFLTCVNADSGESVWKSRDPGDGFFILVDDHLIIATKEGSLHIAPVTTEGYKERAALKLYDDLTWSHPAFADNSIYLKGLNHLARIDIVRGQTQSTDLARKSAPPSSSKFGAFLKKLNAADDKQAVVDQFIATQKTFPIVEKNMVHFVYAGEGTDLAVAGDLFGARQEQPMTRVEGTNLFYHSMPLEADARINYIFMRDYTEIIDPRNDRNTSTNMVGRDMELAFGFGPEFPMSWFAMPDWKEPDYFKDPKSEGKFVVHEVESKIIKPRRNPFAPQSDQAKDESVKVATSVYLPAGYNESEERYPVAYIHGGQAARMKGQITTAMDNMSGRDVAPTILVFINHMPNFFAPNLDYPNFFKDELIPAIDAKFRTIAKPDARASIGHGFAGVSAILCAATSDGKVAKIGTQSPFLFGSASDLIMEHLPPAGDMPATIYYEWGKYDLRNPHENWNMAQGNRDFATAFKEKGFTYHGGEVHDGTDWSSWRNRYDKMFGTLFPPKNQ